MLLLPLIFLPVVLPVEDYEGYRVIREGHDRSHFNLTVKLHMVQWCMVHWFMVGVCFLSQLEQADPLVSLAQIDCELSGDQCAGLCPTLRLASSSWRGSSPGTTTVTLGKWRASNESMT